MNLQVIIQAVETRRSNVEIMLKKLNGLNVIVHYDTKRQGSLQSFIDILNTYPIKSNRLHLQDDCILPNGFVPYLSKVSADVEFYKINVLNLVCLKRNKITEAFERGEKYALFKPFLTLTATLFSKEVLIGLREYANTTKEIKHDDVFVSDYLKKKRIDSFVHLPNIVQHNIYFKSEMGHPSSKSRMSPYYDKDYCINQITNNEKF